MISRKYSANTPVAVGNGVSHTKGFWRAALGVGFGAVMMLPIAAWQLMVPLSMDAQAVPASTRQIGTVKVVLPNKLTIVTAATATAAAQTIDVNVVDGAKVLQLAPGSTDLKTAQAIALGDIEVGDRVLVTGSQDAANAFTASRVILMKSSDIAQKQAAEQEDWQKRGMGGLVSGVDSGSGTITISSRAKKTAIETSPATVYRRYSNGSVKFEDATPGTLADIQVGDQLRVRGVKSDDGLTIKAEEIVSGSFKNLAGTIVSIDAGGESLTLKDLASKKTYSIRVTANSNIRVLPPEAAARFAARAKGGQGGGSATGAAASARPAAAEGDVHAGSGGGSAGGDLSQLIGRLPQSTLAGLHAGDALMVVAEQAQTGSDGLTATTVLSGVEPILAATPKGENSMTLSPWNVGGPDSGGA